MIIFILIEDNKENQKQLAQSPSEFIEDIDFN